MRQRCRNPNNGEYHNYGARGIKVCAAWDDFARFVADVGPRPSKRHTLDRINNDKGYEPGNVRWALPATQTRNGRKAKLTMDQVLAMRAAYAAGGVTHAILALRFGVHKATVQHALQGRNWK